MNPRRRSTRRQFLRGRAAADAVADLVERLGSAAPDEGPASTDFLMHVGRRAMACQFEVYFDVAARGSGLPAALEALDLIEALEDQMTVYRETSELVALNSQAARQPVVVEARLWHLLALALDLHHRTRGAFDITAGPLTRLWGFYRRRGALPAPADVEQTLNLVGSGKLVLDEQELTVKFELAGMELNLGSIGKGYALDRACEPMDAAGLTSFLWQAGQSSVLARGDHPGRTGGGWRIGVRHPLRPRERLAQFTLRDQALATSGGVVQSFRHAGRRYGHLIDPRTGQPASGVLSATVVAPSAADADALSTAFYILGKEAAVEVCAELGNVALLLVVPRSDGAGIDLVTRGFQENGVELETLPPDQI